MLVVNDVPSNAGLYSVILDKSHIDRLKLLLYWIEGKSDACSTTPFSKTRKDKATMYSSESHSNMLDAELNHSYLCNRVCFCCESICMACNSI